MHLQPHFALGLGKHPVFSIFAILAIAALGVCAGAARGESETMTEVLAAPALQGFHSLIVNGTVSSAYPTIGALLLFDDTAASSLYGLCSGTLIGCRTFLTAAHCVCPEDTDDAPGCGQGGTADPATLRVFLQHGGILAASKVVISPDYSFADRGDFAVITLGEPVTGITPSALNTISKTVAGAAGSIVGFGVTRNGFMSANDAGVKREGTVRTTTCTEDIRDDMNVCWEFSGTGANVCSGDSGGPLFVDFGSGPVVAGVTSGSYSDDCEPPDISFDSDVFVYHSWIADAADVDLEGESCGLAAVGNDTTRVLAQSGQLNRNTTEARVDFDVPAGTAVLRVGLNGQLGSGSGFSSSANDFDLFVRAGSAPTTVDYDCADTNSTTFGFCEIDAPTPGTWHALVHLKQGEGLYQLTTTTFAPATEVSCTGDCNGDVTVGMDEVLTAVDRALGQAESAYCTQADANNDGVVTVDEVIQAVKRERGGCAS